MLDLLQPSIFCLLILVLWVSFSMPKALPSNKTLSHKTRILRGKKSFLIDFYSQDSYCESIDFYYIYIFTYFINLCYTLLSKNSTYIDNYYYFFLHIIVHWHIIIIYSCEYFSSIIFLQFCQNLSSFVLLEILLF